MSNGIQKLRQPFREARESLTTVSRQRLKHCLRLVYFFLLLLDGYDGLFYVLLGIVNCILQILEAPLMLIQFLFGFIGFSSSLRDFYLSASNVTTSNNRKSFILIDNILFETFYRRIETLDRFVDPALFGLRWSLIDNLH